jgi:hypothetical protein
MSQVSETVPSYKSDESFFDSDSDDENIPPRKRTRQEVAYETSRTFSDIQEAKVFVKEQNLWQFKYKSISSFGDKLIYLCKYSSKCSSRLCIFLPNDTEFCHIQTNNLDHDHSTRQLTGIHQTTKAAINQLWESGVKKPKSILEALRKQSKIFKVKIIYFFINYYYFFKIAIVQTTFSSRTI